MLRFASISFVAPLFHCSLAPFLDMSTENCVVDPLTVENLWTTMNEGRVQTKIVPDAKGAVNSPPSSLFLKVVMISDTHCELGKMIEQNMIPDGDVLIHAGDITTYGDEENLKKFNEELGRLPHAHKLVIAGNHEFGFDEEKDKSKSWHQGPGTPEGWKLLTNCTFLQESTAVIDGVTFYGASWHPLEGFPFYRPREALKEKWENIPAGVDVIITHTPPICHLDLFEPVERWGCRYLLEKVEQLRPQLHVFGHNHHSHGAVKNKHTIFVNAASGKPDRDGFNRPLVAYIPKKL